VVQGQSPYSGVRWAKPPEAESLLAFGHPKKAAKFAAVTKLRLCNVSKFNTIPYTPFMHLADNLGIKMCYLKRLKSGVH